MAAATNKKKTVSRAELFRIYFGEQIKKRREELGVTQEELAKKLKKDQPRIVDLQKGRLKDIDVYFNCLKVLGGELSFSWHNYTNK